MIINAQPEDCKIELFPKTLLRGTPLALDNNMADLAIEDFDNKVQSIRVSGKCNWTVFRDVGYRGRSQLFLPGEYKNAATIRTVLRKASSVRNEGC